MKIIGLTGKSGAGKGAVAAILAEHGFPHIDCDKVYHSLLSADSPCTRELTDNFGDSITAQDGSVDRKKLADLVFKGEDKEKRLDTLNKITHKHVLGKCRELIAEHKKLGAGAIIIDAPTLHESGFDKECDIILTVTADIPVRLERIMKRDSLTREKAMERIRAQKEDEFYISRADHVIENNSDISELYEKTENFIREKLN